MTNFICEGEKYILKGSKEDSIGLPIVLSGLPEKIEVEGYSLLRKSTFHVTLVAIGEIMEKYKIDIPNFSEKIVLDFCKFTKASNINLIRFRDEFRFVWENESRSVIAMCDISNVNDFFDIINKRYNLQLEYPPAHVTLYTLRLDGGIFITSSEDIQKMTKLIKNPGIELNV